MATPNVFMREDRKTMNWNGGRTRGVSDDPLPVRNARPGNVAKLDDAAVHASPGQVALKDPDLLDPDGGAADCGVGPVAVGAQPILNFVTLRGPETELIHR